MYYYPSFCGGNSGVIEAANKSAEKADILLRRRVSLASSVTP
jgi:hypothetical protein